MLTLTFASMLMLFVAYDVSVCLSFYREANRGGAMRLPSVSQPRPRRLAPDQVTLRHALLFLVQKANYYWQLVTALPLLARLHLRPTRATDRDVALLILDTSLMTWVTARPLAEGGLVATLRMEGFAFPLLPDRFDNVLVVEIERHHGDGGLGEARTLRFELNGVAIDAREEQLSILAMMVSSVSHPVIHAFNNRLYESHADPRLHDFGDLFLHGQYLNWCAWYWPGVMFRIPGPRRHHWYKRVLAHNAELELPKHDHRSMIALAPYARSVRFLLKARGVLANLRKKYALPVDGEALFLCTILHAVDHASCDRHVRGRLLRNEKLPNDGWFNLIALLYYRPAQHFWTNLLRDKQHKNAMYGELYAGLRELDPELADEVTLSISY